MPIPGGAAHINLVGVAPHGEEFATGFWLDMDTPPGNAAEAQTVVANLATILATDDVGAPWRLLPTTAAYTQIRGYFYATGNDGSAQLVGTAAYPQTGTAANQTLPLQCAMCVSTRSEFPGATNRGRMYVPATGAGLAVGQFTQAAIDNATDWWSDRFTEINASAAVGGTVAILSQKLGTMRAVRSVTADSRVDIQRRRANRETVLATSSEDVSP